MDNQHTKIRGYRDLTYDEIDMMNRAKRLEAEVLAFHGEVMQYLSDQEESGGAEERVRQQEAFAHRWAMLGKDDIEKGFMSMVRAIAQPQPKS